MSFFRSPSLLLIDVAIAELPQLVDELLDFDRSFLTVSSDESTLNLADADFSFSLLADASLPPADVKHYLTHSSGLSSDDSYSSFADDFSVYDADLSNLIDADISLPTVYDDDFEVPRHLKPRLTVHDISIELDVADLEEGDLEPLLDLSIDLPPLLATDFLPRTPLTIHDISIELSSSDLLPSDLEPLLSLDIDLPPLLDTDFLSRTPLTIHDITIELHVDDLNDEDLEDLLAITPSLPPLLDTDFLSRTPLTVQDITIDLDADDLEEEDLEALLDLSIDLPPLADDDFPSLSPLAELQPELDAIKLAALAAFYTINSRPHLKNNALATLAVQQAVKDAFLLSRA